MRDVHTRSNGHVHFAAIKGRPLGERKGSPHTYTWCCWWTTEPVMAPFTLPDAHGGAPTRADVPSLVQQVAPPGATLKWLPALWAQEWREVQRWGVERRAEDHALRAREHERWLQEARERAADPLWQWRWQQQTAAWIEYRDSPAGLGTPEWAELLGLSWPTFTRADLDASWRAKARSAHPDRGGDHDTFVALEQARRAALTHLGAT